MSCIVDVLNVVSSINSYSSAQSDSPATWSYQKASALHSITERNFCIERLPSRRLTCAYQCCVYSRGSSRPLPQMSGKADSRSDLRYNKLLMNRVYKIIVRHASVFSVKSSIQWISACSCLLGTSKSAQRDWPRRARVPQIFVLHIVRRGEGCSTPQWSRNHQANCRSSTRKRPNDSNCVFRQ